MTLPTKAQTFRSLHVPGDPLVLYNIWDAGSAVAVARAGAKAIATGSWSVAAAQGYADGEEMPLDDALAVVARILARTEKIGSKPDPDFVAAVRKAADRQK